jgi:acetyl-CoA C-acetyltransferase
MNDVVIASAARTAMGKFGGAQARISAPELGAIAIRSALERVGGGMDVAMTVERA